MRAFEIRSGDGVAGLRRVERDDPKLGPNQVRVAITACALNYRDLMVANGQYPATMADPLVPVADGCGRVVEVGADVTRFRPGDRVLTPYFPEWADGAASPGQLAVSYGSALDGVLAERLVAAETGLIAAPDGLDDAEAATLPCAAVTAWNALFETGALKPGDTALVQGTGGVSVFALQLAAAAGIATIVTSSSDERLERARALGARSGINYREQPEWQDAVLRETGGLGADVVVEVGGAGTLGRSVTAARFGGRVVVIGGLSGFEGARVDPWALIGGNKVLAGVMVGSRAMTARLIRFVDRAGIRPVIDRRFGFDAAADAFRHLENGGAFGKVVIELPG